MKEIHQFISEMSDSSSSNAKKAVLTKWSKNNVIKTLLNYTYNPYKHHAFIRTDTEYSVRTAEWVDMMIDDYIDEPVIAWGAR